MNETGPMRQNATIMNMLPVSEAILGFKNLSTDHPQIGAVSAYNPPLITNTRPRITGLRPNCLRWGSSTAVRKPMEALVAIIDREVTRTPGMHRIFPNESENEMGVFQYEINILYGLIGRR